MEDRIDSEQLDAVCSLAFKYMELCTVCSSSDSETEPSRWSDVSSSRGCESSSAENREHHGKRHRLHPILHQQDLDPYDGSSEGSGTSEDERGKGTCGSALKEPTFRSRTSNLLRGDVWMQNIQPKRNSTEMTEEPQPNQDMETEPIWSKTRRRSSREEPELDSVAEMELCDSGLHSSPLEVNLKCTGNPEVLKRKLPELSAEEEEVAVMRRKRCRTRELEPEESSLREPKRWTTLVSDPGFTEPKENNNGEHLYLKRLEID